MWIIDSVSFFLPRSSSTPRPKKLMRRLTAALALALLTLSSTLSAQAEKPPRRPKLPASADTNNAHAYYDFALDNLKNDPDKAADALYWSTRLEPTWADAFYARRVALLLSDPRRLRSYWAGDRRTIQSDDVRRIDSLFYYALTINPFVSQTLDRQLFEAVADDIAKQYERAGAGNATEIRFVIDREMQSASPAMKGWLAYGDGRFGEALTYYAIAIKGDKRNEPLRVDRARVLYQTNQLDSALAELKLAVEDMRKRDKKDLIYVYQSKALAEHSIAVVNQRLGHTDAAREALGQALQEDLSYYPAHLQLALMSLDAKDTTGALSELELAVQLRGDDAVARFLYGFTLATTGKSAEAEAELRKAVELNPIYAAPRYAHAEVLERLGRKADALIEYQNFLVRASKTDGRRQSAEERSAALKSSGLHQ